MGIWTAELYADIAKGILDDFENDIKGAGSPENVSDWLYSARVTVTIASIRVHLSSLKRAARVLFQMRTGTYKQCRDAIKSCFKSKVVYEFEPAHFSLFYRLGRVMHERLSARSNPTKGEESQSVAEERDEPE